MSEQEKVLTEQKVLTETEMDQVAGGGNAYGQDAQATGYPAWTFNSGNAKSAPGHNKP
jgi:hypothetical protein